MSPTVPFFKYHGLGNDFIIVDAVDDAALAQLAWNSIAPAWCRRHTGIGADGVLVLSRCADADVAMRIVNSDGSDAQMCGNGIRCVAKYVIERRGVRKSSLKIRTGSGVLAVTAEVRDGGGTQVVDRVTVNMGLPRFRPSQVPVRAGGDSVLDAPLAGFSADIDPRVLSRLVDDLAPFVAKAAPSLCAVSMGNPHAVLFVERLDELPLHDLGPRLERFPAFPEKTNVHFVKVLTPTHAVMRTWERGAGATSACGTGACAVLAAGVKTGRLRPRATITVPGGDLELEWRQEPTETGAAGIFKTGPAAEVFRGTAESGETP